MEIGRLELLLIIMVAISMEKTVHGILTPILKAFLIDEEGNLK